MDYQLKDELVGLLARDQSKRQQLLERGELYEGYHPEMEQVHQDNAARLEQLLESGTWPSVSDVGEEGAEAAWIVCLHAISRPAFQRRCLLLLDAAVRAGAAPPRHLAYLVDRIRFNERKPQVYGTVLDWDAKGELSCWPVEDPELLAERRRRVGIPPLESILRDARARARLEQEGPPKPYRERQTEIEAWARRVGWLADDAAR